MRQVLIATLLVVCSPTLWAGQEVGSGGDAVSCTASRDNTFVGTYSLDYLLTYTESNNNQDVVEVPSVEQSLQRIRARLAEKLPEFLESFNEFTQLIRNTDVLQPRFWEEAPFGLVDIKDENLLHLVPMNCRNGEKVQIVQAIIRQNFLNAGVAGDKTIYRFVPRVFNDLQLNAPVQLSFLLVHEWLWDISHNVDRNRRINRFLHSVEFDRLSAAQVRAKLTALGLEFPKEVAPVPFYFDHCPANPAYAQSFAARLRGHSQQMQVARDQQQFMRMFQCRIDDVAGCQVSTQLMTRSKRVRGEIRSLFASDQGGKIVLTFMIGNFASDFVNCELNESNAQLTCGEMASGDFFFGSYVPRPTGTIGANGCVRITDTEYQLSRQPENSFFTKREIVITSQIE